MQKSKYPTRKAHIRWELVLLLWAKKIAQTPNYGFIYTGLTQQSAQSFRPAPSGQFDMTPLVGNRGIIVNARHTVVP